jgi:hypothetical protein
MKLTGKVALDGAPVTPIPMGVAGLVGPKPAGAVDVPSNAEPG